MMHYDNFHFVGRSQNQQVSINVWISEYILSFHIRMRKNYLWICQINFLIYSTDAYLSVYSVSGLILGTGNVIVNDPMKNPAHMGYVLESKAEWKCKDFSACIFILALPFTSWCYLCPNDLMYLNSLFLLCWNGDDIYLTGLSKWLNNKCLYLVDNIQRYFTLRSVMDWIVSSSKRCWGANS